MEKQILIEMGADINGERERERESECEAKRRILMGSGIDIGREIHRYCEKEINRYQESDRSRYLKEVR